MNKSFLLLPFFLCAMGYADQTQETFLKANAYYEQGRVAHALDLYKKIPSPYPAVFYNSGLCYYALENYSQALAAFRKAERLGNRSLYKKASHAAVLTQKKIGLVKDSSFFQTALALHTMIPGDWVRFFFLLALALFSLMVWMRRTTTRLLVAGSVFLVLMGTCCGYDYWFSQQQYGVVIPKTISVYTGPDKQFHKVAELPAGQQVKVVEQQQSWYKVYFPVGQGWIEQADLGVF